MTPALAAAAQAADDFTWPDIAFFAICGIVIVAVVYLVMRD